MDTVIGVEIWVDTVIAISDILDILSRKRGKICPRISSEIRGQKICLLILLRKREKICPLISSTISKENKDLCSYLLRDLLSNLFRDLFSYRGNIRDLSSYSLAKKRNDLSSYLFRKLFSHHGNIRDVLLCLFPSLSRGTEFSTKEPLNIGLFCWKWPIKIRDPMSLSPPCNKVYGLRFSIRV